jgi:hypothetical protein
MKYLEEIGREQERGREEEKERERRGDALR